MNDMLAAAVDLAANGWPIFPLRGKIPAIPNPHPKGSPERQTCKGECGTHGHGVLDATTDRGQIDAWWSGAYHGANIGARVPEPLCVLDIDPRSGGHERLTELEQTYGTLPETLTVHSGREDGGRHLYWLRPGGQLSATRLGKGLDLKTHGGYCVMPPSVHPATGRPYRWEPRPVSAAPTWLARLLREQPAPPQRRPARPFAAGTGASIADAYSNERSWSDVLEPHGWVCLDFAPDGDGARWRHPDATHPHSATIRHGLLFVYSQNTPFEITEAATPRGYTRFRAYAVLNHGGNLPAAARALRAEAGAA